MAAWCDHEQYDDRREAYGQHVGTGTIEDYGDDWFDFGQPDTAVQELVGIVDRFSLHLELLSGRDAA